MQQPYYNEGSNTISALGQTLHDDVAGHGTPAVSKQASAFPPNYIHSLDASHMMMTAAACQRAGIAFAGVHDSFWTHAADVPVMRDTLRATFVELYSKGLLEALRADLQQALVEVGSDVVLPPPPKVGDLDLEQVLESTYFFN